MYNLGLPLRSMDELFHLYDVTITSQHGLPSAGEFTLIAMPAAPTNASSTFIKKLTTHDTKRQKRKSTCTKAAKYVNHFILAFGKEIFYLNGIIHLPPRY